MNDVDISLDSVYLRLISKCSENLKRVSVNSFKCKKGLRGRARRKNERTTGKGENEDLKKGQNSVREEEETGIDERQASSHLSL